MSSSATKEMPGIKVITTRNTGRLVLSGEITLHSAADIRDRLLELFREKKKITVDVSRITRVDSSIFQLICAARRRALALEQELVIKCKEGSAFLIDAAEAGFHKSGGCNISDSGVLLWDRTSCSDQGG